MTPDELLRRYGDAWDELERQLAKAGRSGAGRRRVAPGAGLRSLARRYREAAGHLSAARTYFPDAEVTRYLNGLVGRAHLYIYGSQKGDWKAVGGFFGHGFADALRDARPFFGLAWLVTLLSACAGFLVVFAAPQNLYWIFPSSFVQQFNPARTGPHAVVAPVISSLIMTHNIEVAVMAFLGAFSFGIFTLYVLYQNGLILGALAALFFRAGRSLVFWSLILPHGCIELTAINIAGAAGMMTGYRFLVPGRLGRWQSLQRAAVLAARLLMGVASMLVVAGTIEGFLTPSDAPVWFKYSFAALTVIGLVYYFSRGRRRRSRSLPAVREVGL